MLVVLRGGYGDKVDRGVVGRRRDTVVYSVLSKLQTCCTKESGLATGQRSAGSKRVNICGQSAAAMKSVPY